MPPAKRAKGVFDSGKTSSYHIKSIAACAQSNKNSPIFKLLLTRAATGATSKRYDFEAESPKLAGTWISFAFGAMPATYDWVLIILAFGVGCAAEIVANIKNLRMALERSGTLNKSRRSRQIVL